MVKYLLAFALSYTAALLVFAVMGTVSLFRWPVGPVPMGFFLLWVLLSLAAAYALGLCFARRWADAVGALSAQGVLILLVSVSMLVFAARLAEPLQPLTAPGRLAGMALVRLLARREAEYLPLTFAGSLLYPLLFHLGWRMGA